jgi:hypothetical protein
VGLGDLGGGDMTCAALIVLAFIAGVWCACYRLRG